MKRTLHNEYLSPSVSVFCFRAERGFLVSDGFEQPEEGYVDNL